MDSTALRRSGSPRGDDGTRLLRAPRQTYQDGAEARVLEILRASSDVSMASAELAVAGRGWAERYHLSAQRGGILEFLDIPAGSRVLEIGAGCGPITRHLGERGAIVDAVEPMPARAAANRERCRDLEQVEVFVGELDDVPVEPSYDLVVVIGVLEYVGAGLTAPGPYLEFLSGLARRLVPGGQLALAIENQLGVKYFAGSAEDHTNRIFDGIEGYPRHSSPEHPNRGIARTFPRNQLTGMITAAGFTVDRVLTAFPDYKLTRAVLDSSIDEVDPSLAYRIPQFPSPDHVMPRPEVLDEYATWRTLVKAGLAWEFGNSFLVCARLGEGAARLWPEGQYAGFATLERRTGLAARTRLVAGADGPEFHRHFEGEFTGSELKVTGGTAAYIPGRDLLEVLGVSDDEAIADLLRAWSARLDQLDWTAGAPIDALPHNLIVTSDGSVELIDDELRAPDWTREQVLARGIFWTAAKLAEQTAPDRWPCATVADLALLLGSTFPELTGDWLGEAVRAEAGLQCIVLGADRQTLEDVLGGKLATPLGDLGLGYRVWDRAAGTEADYLAARAETATLSAELDQQRTRLEAERESSRTLGDELSHVRDELSHVKDELSRAGTDLTGSKSVAADLQSRLEERTDEFVRQQAQLNEILASRSFRWGSSLARLAHRTLGPIRRRVHR